MRLVGGVQAFSSRIFGERFMGDVQSLYGGDITYMPSDHYGGEKIHFDSFDEQVHASVAPPKKFGGLSVSTVRITNLQEPVNTCRWTALQAYRIRGGLNFTRVIVEVPGVYAYQEWQGRAALSRQDNGADKSTTGVIPNFSTTLAQGSQISRQTPATWFHAEGTDLPATAHTLAKSYSDMVYHCDDDPEGTVAGVLGVRTLSFLGALWESAMRQQTPLDAARLVMETLTDLG